MIPVIITLVLLAEDAPKPNPELDSANARITWLEQALAATQKKAQACFDIYSADMTLNALAKQDAQIDAQAKQQRPPAPSKPERK